MGGHPVRVFQHRRTAVSTRRRLRRPASVSPRRRQAASPDVFMRAETLTSYYMEEGHQARLARRADLLLVRIDGGGATSLLRCVAFGVHDPDPPPVQGRCCPVRPTTWRLGVPLRKPFELRVGRVARSARRPPGMPSAVAIRTATWECVLRRGSNCRRAARSGCALRCTRCRTCRTNVGYFQPVARHPLNLMSSGLRPEHRLREPGSMRRLVAHSWEQLDGFFGTSRSD